MKRLIISLFLVSLLGCACNKAEENNPQLITTNGIRISVEPGEYWAEKKKIFIFTLDRTPQMAAWIENSQGHYISTITVTNRSGKQNWIMLIAPKEGRPEALPVWFHRINNDKSQIDGVTSATPKGAVEIKIDNNSLINGHEYNVYLEINQSFDFNETWPEHKDDVNGQPSLIYYAKFIAGVPGKIELNPIGHGSANGSDGNITLELGGITTALKIIKDVYIIID